MAPTKYCTEDKFGLLIDLRSMADQTMHGSGTRLIDVQNGVFLETERALEGTSDMNCHVFVLSDAQMKLENSQLEYVQY